MGWGAIGEVIKEDCPEEVTLNRDLNEMRIDS